MSISLFRHAFFLILLGLLGAFAIPQMAVPRLGLSAHSIAMLGGVLQRTVCGQQGCTPSWAPRRS